MTPKNSSKWRLLKDLRAINAVIALMGAQQPRIPNPAMIPETWELLIIDLEDCFFTIALYPDDAPHFAFSLPSLINSEPMQRDHWAVLLQRMKMSYDCRLLATSALQPVQQQFSVVLLYHYMDDILLAADDSLVLQNSFVFWGLSLDQFGLCIAADKVQTVPPWKYLGFLSFEQKIVPQPIVLPTSIKILHDLQKLLGTTNWLRPTLDISTEELSPLLNSLKGDTDLPSPCELSPESREALQIVTDKIQTSFVSKQQSELLLRPFVIIAEFQPYALIAQ